MDIKYVNSSGTIICFTEAPFYMLRDTDLFDYAWDFITTGYNYPRVVTFNKLMKEKKITVYVTGKTESDYYANLEYLTNIIDHDVTYKIKGKLYVGDYYVEGYFIKSEKTDKYLTSTRSGITLTFLIEDFTWRTDYTVELTPQLISNIAERYIIVSDSGYIDVREYNYIRFTETDYLVRMLGYKNGELVRTLMLYESDIEETGTEGYVEDISDLDSIRFTNTNWITASLITVLPDFTSDNYEYDYEYDLKSDVKSITITNSDTYAESNWRLTIQGEANDIKMYINDVVISLNLTLRSVEQLIIDSKNKTAIVYNSVTGDSTNVFNLRDKNYNLFELVDEGDLVISWRGFKYASFTTYKDRSEPIWN